nr:translation initiation factor IF-2-like [Setaria viridis]
MPLRTLDPFRPTHSALTPHRAAPVGACTAPSPSPRITPAPSHRITPAPPPPPRPLAPHPRTAARRPRRPAARRPVAPQRAGPYTAPSPPRTAPAHAREGLASVSLDSLAWEPDPKQQQYLCLRRRPGRRPQAAPRQRPGLHGQGQVRTPPLPAPAALLNLCVL